MVRLVGTAPQTVTLLLVASFMLAACKPSAPSKDEIDRLIDERLAERGLPPLPFAPGSSASPTTSAPPAPTKSLTDDLPATSLSFLARLDELMRDYAPSLPIVEDRSDVLRCLATDAENNPDLQKVVSAVKRHAEAAKSLYALAFHYDLDWQTREMSGSPTYDCWCDRSRWLNYRYSLRKECEYHDNCEWKIRSSGHALWFVYSGSEKPATKPPELMRRMDAAGIKPLSRFSCRVADMMREQDHKIVRCRSSGTGTSLRVSGSVKPLNVGDLVSVPLADTERDPDGVLFKNVAVKNGGWVVDADAAMLTVDAAATCPSVAEILAALGDAGKP